MGSREPSACLVFYSDNLHSILLLYSTLIFSLEIFLLGLSVGFIRLENFCVDWRNSLYRRKIIETTGGSVYTFWLWHSKVSNNSIVDIEIGRSSAERYLLVLDYDSLY